jgi:hypothetical protein
MVFIVAVAGQHKDNSEKWAPLVYAVKDVLAGKKIASDSILISPGAYLVKDGTFTNLRSVALGELRTVSLTEDASRSGASITMKINDPENAAYLMLKTVSATKDGARYHTVVFMKDDKGRWVIQAWHTSGEGAK